MKQATAWLLAGALLWSAQSSGSHTAGPFRKPYNENQTWVDANGNKLCTNNVGWSSITQYHMEWNDGIDPNTGLPINKYHLGEDWNGKCGGNTDEGAPLYGLGNGTVEYINTNETPGKGKQLAVRYTFPYSKEATGEMVIGSLYLHLKNILVTGVGASVSGVQQIATLGKTGTGTAHLHWEITRSLNFPNGNPYQNPLTVSTALQYLPPSLIVDDRIDALTFGGTAGQWTVFQMNGYAPSSIAYVEYNGERKSLQNAVNAGWMYSSGIPVWNGTAWTWPPLDTVFFQDAQWYAWMPMVNGAVLHILRPKNTYRADRARLDILRAATGNTLFQNIRTESYSENLAWDTSWELRQMYFNGANQSLLYGWIFQATNKTNPLLRYTGYYDPQTGVWTGWQQVDWNRLY